MLPKLGLLTRNTLWMVSGQGLRILVQFVYFVLIARVLHTDGYGAFSGVVALVSVFFPFAGWGTGNLLIKNVARDAQSFRTYWGRALLMAAISGGALVVLAVVLGSWILPPAASPAVILVVAIADLLFTRILEVSCQAFQAHQRMRETAFLLIMLAVARLCAVLVLMRAHGSDELLTWAFLYLGGSVAVAVVGLVWASRKFGAPRWDVAGWRREFGEGFYFAASVSAQRIYMDSDKTLLTRLSTLQGAGIYSVGARVIEVVLVPVYSLLAAAYASFFLRGREGLSGSMKLSRQLMPFALLYSALIAVCLYVFAPLLPRLLGDEFADAVLAVRWLAFVPLLTTAHRFAADSLTGAGYQGVRTSCELVAALCNVSVNLVLLPRFGWRGAAASTLGTELMLAISLWAAVRWYSRIEVMARGYPDEEGSPS